MVLPALVEQYLSCRFVSAKYASELRSLARRVQDFSGNGHIPSTEEVVAWLKSLDVETTTVNTYRRYLLVIYNWMYSEGIISQKPTIPRHKQTEKVPEAWTAQEVEKLLDVVNGLDGTVGKHPASKWWAALIHAVYWTGARIGSILKASPEDFDSERMILKLRKTKNGRERSYQLHPVAVEAILAVFDPDAELLFFWPYSYNHLFKAFRKLVVKAGIRYKPGKKFQLFHRLRRTTITYCWIADPALAQRQADHTSAEITKRHYVDPVIAEEALSAVNVLPVLGGKKQLLLFPQERAS